jgi:two-component system OmpR family response regulator
VASILVVDDDPDVRDLIAGILRPVSHDVVTCANGVDAVAQAEGREFDIALIDIRMEPLDGVETTSRLRQLRPDLKVAMITAFATHTSTHADTIEKIVAAKSLGVTRFLTKPFHKDEVLGLVNRLLELNEA